MNSHRVLLGAALFLILLGYHTACADGNSEDQFNIILADGFTPPTAADVPLGHSSSSSDGGSGSGSGTLTHTPAAPAADPTAVVPSDTASSVPSPSPSAASAAVVTAEDGAVLEVPKQQPQPSSRRRRYRPPHYDKPNTKMGPVKQNGPVFLKLLAKDVTPIAATLADAPAAAAAAGGAAVAAGVKAQTATLAAGCFWSVELMYQRLPGVLATAVGYTAGHTENPTYKQVCTGTTGHAEAVQLTFDPSVITYEDILNVFWERHDSTTLNRQGGDVGTQYRSGIYYHDEEQHKIAEASKEAHQKKVSDPIVTEIVAFSKFWPAEDYHQQYLQKGGQCAAKGDTSLIRCYG